MVYKSKKLNKRRYFKKQSRKRMYGGEGDIPQEKDEQVKMDVDTPTIVENIGNAASVLASGISTVIADKAQTVSENIGIDPNISLKENIKEGISNTGEFLKDINEEMNSPEGQELLNETGQVAKNVVKTLEPAAEESLNTINNLVKKEMPILTDMGEKFVLGLPVIGTGVAAVEEAVDAVAATSTAAASLGHLSETGSKVLVDLSKQKTKFQSLIDKGIELYNNANRSIGNIISSAKEKVDDYGKSVMKRKMEYNPENLDDTLQDYQKKSTMIGGRIMASKSEFLYPSVNSSQILQQYGGKLKTRRRHYLKRKITSRRYK